MQSTAASGKRHTYGGVRTRIACSARREGKNRIKAQWDNVSDTTLATTIGNNGTAVSTIEHLMSALCGMGVDNAIIEVDAPEIPIMDGSALPFVHLLKEAGTVAQGNGKKALVVNREVSVSDPSGTASLLPAAEFKITYKIDFPHPLIGQQSYEMVFSDALYEREIAPARTFGFLKDDSSQGRRRSMESGSAKRPLTRRLVSENCSTRIGRVASVASKPSRHSFLNRHRAKGARGSRRTKRRCAPTGGAPRNVSKSRSDLDASGRSNPRGLLTPQISCFPARSHSCIWKPGKLQTDTSSGAAINSLSGTGRSWRKGKNTPVFPICSSCPSHAGMRKSAIRTMIRTTRTCSCSEV